MTEIRQTIIDNIRAVCKVKKLRQKDIAERMGVSPGSVTNWFKGTNFIDVDNLYKLCQILGVSLDQIFGVAPIVFGALNEEENEVIQAYRLADPVTKSNIRRVLEIPEKTPARSGSVG